MPRKIKPATMAQVHKLEAALGFLNKARDCLRAADCPKTLQRVRAAIDSGDGAYRHIRHRLRRTDAAALTAPAS